MQTLYNTARSLVENVAPSSPTLYEPTYNSYQYGYAQDDQGAIGLVRLPGYTVPGGTLNVGWTDAGKRIYVGGFPFVGSVTLPTGATRYLSVTDCSGFAAYLVQNAGPEAYDQLVRAVPRMHAAAEELRQLDAKHDQPWPSAADYAFAGSFPELLPGWSVVASQDSPAAFPNAQPGDVLAWSAPLAARDSGHVMIVASAPAEVREGTWQLQVFESTAGGSQSGQVQVSFYQGAWYVGFDDFGPGGGFPADRVSVLRVVSAD